MCVQSLFFVKIFFYITIIIHEAYGNTDQTLKVYPDRAVLLPSNPVKTKGDVLIFTCITPANFTEKFSAIDFNIFHDDVPITDFTKSTMANPFNVQKVEFNKVLGENDDGNYTCTIQAKEGPKPWLNYTASTFVKILTDTETMAHQVIPVVEVRTNVSIQCLDKPHEGLVVNWEGGSSQSNTWDFTLDSLDDVSTRICRIATETALNANDNDMDKAVASGSAGVIPKDFIGVKNSTEVLDGIFNISFILKPSDVNQLPNLSLEWTSKGDPLQDIHYIRDSMLISTVVVNKTMEPISVNITFKGIVIEQFRNIPLVVNGQKTQSSSHFKIVLGTVIPFLTIIFVVYCLRRQKKCCWKESGQGGEPRPEGVPMVDGIQKLE